MSPTNVLKKNTKKINTLVIKIDHSRVLGPLQSWMG